MNYFAAGQALVEGRVQRGEIDMQRKIEQFNISVAEQNARLTGQQTSAREEQQRRESRQLLGTQRAAIAQSNVGFDGSSADIIRQSSANAELDALNIRYAGELERMGFLNEIEMRKYSDQMLKLKGKQVMRMRWGNALGALFGGGAGQQQISKALDRNNNGPSGGGKVSHTWASGARGAYGGFGRVGTGPG